MDQETIESREDGKDVIAKENRFYCESIFVASPAEIDIISRNLGLFELSDRKSLLSSALFKYSMGVWHIIGTPSFSSDDELKLQVSSVLETHRFTLIGKSSDELLPTERDKFVLDVCRYIKIFMVASTRNLTLAEIEKNVSDPISDIIGVGVSVGKKYGVFS